MRVLARESSCPPLRISDWSSRGLVDAECNDHCAQNLSMALMCGHEDVNSADLAEDVGQLLMPPRRPVR